MYNAEKEITITISSNRNNFYRIINNLNSIKCRKIIIHGNKENIKEILPIDWEYYHCPELNHYQRHYKSINLVKTPYVLEVAEDDLYSIDFIIKSIEFLNKNKNYISCRGAVLGFSENDKSISLNCHLTKSQLSIFKKLISDNFFSNDIIERIKYHSNYKNLLNPSRNVKRTSIQLGFLKFLNTYTEYWPLSYIDRIYIAHEAASGNIKTLPFLQLIKSQGNRTQVENDLQSNKKYNDIKNHLDSMIFYYIDNFNLSYNSIKEVLYSIDNKSVEYPKNVKEEYESIYNIKSEIENLIRQYL